MTFGYSRYAKLVKALLLLIDVSQIWQVAFRVLSICQVWKITFWAALMSEICQRAFWHKGALCFVWLSLSLSRQTCWVAFVAVLSSQSCIFAVLIPRTCQDAFFVVAMSPIWQIPFCAFSMSKTWQWRLFGAKFDKWRFVPRQYSNLKISLFCCFNVCNLSNAFCRDLKLSKSLVVKFQILLIALCLVWMSQKLEKVRFVLFCCFKLSESRLLRFWWDQLVREAF